MNQKDHILVIDEAANLKECETIVPLVLREIKHVLLNGDGQQLSSLVKSVACHCIRSYECHLI